MTDSPPTNASLSEAHPVTGPEQLPPEPPSNGLTWFILGAIVVAVLLLLFRRRQPVARELTADEWARTQLSAILTSNGEGHSLGEVLTRVIRDYVQRRFGASIEAKTTSEAAAAMRNVGMNDSQVTEWCRLLDRCDLAKFARRQFASAESAETLRRAQTLLSSTLPPDESSTPAKTGEFR